MVVVVAGYNFVALLHGSRCIADVAEVLSGGDLGVCGTAVRHERRPRVESDQIHVALLRVADHKGVDGEDAKDVVAFLLTEMGTAETRYF